MILGIVGFGLMMRRTTYGLRIYAVGGNRLASEIAGVKTGRVLFSVYAISGAWPASPESCSHPASSAAHRPWARLRTGRHRRRRHRRGGKPHGRTRHHLGAQSWASCSSRPSTTAWTSSPSPPLLAGRHQRRAHRHRSRDRRMGQQTPNLTTPLHHHQQASHKEKPINED